LNSYNYCTFCAKSTKSIQGTKTRFPAWQHFSFQHDAQTVCPLKTIICYL
jgi:hypothetical protein